MLNESHDILERLAVADREHQKERASRLVLGAVNYVCGFVLATFALDVALHLSGHSRLGLLLALLMGLLGVACVGWYVAFAQRNRLEHIARFLETRDSALGSRLINLLQLQKQAEDLALAPLTQSLARQAVQRYAEELRSTPLERMAWTGQVRAHLRQVAWTMLGCAVVLLVFFRITATEVPRFVDPFGDHPPYSLTRLDIVTPGVTGTNVLYGKGIIVSVKAVGHRPKDVFLTSHPVGHPEQAITVAMFEKSSLRYDQLVDNIRTESLVWAHTKDNASLSKRLRIGVVLTPKLEKAFAQISPPNYTGLKPEEKPYSFKALQALEGSELRFRLQSNRPLRDGTLEIINGDQQPKTIVLNKSAQNEISCSFLAADSGRLRFSMVDEAGLPSQDVWEGALTVTHDLPPEIRVTEPENDAFVAIDFKLKVHIEASDDYGLRTVRIHRGVNGIYPEPRVVSYDSIVRNAHEVFELNFAEMGVQPNDVVSLFAEALDTAPEPHLARSQTVRLRVISVEDYNNYLRERTDIADAEAKYSALMDDLQTLIENQKELGDSARELRKQLAKANPKEREELTRKFDQLLAKQNELNEKLNKHAQRIEHFVRETPLYDVERELDKFLRQEADDIRQSTATNNGVARDIAQRSSPASGPRQVSPDMADQLKKASDEQVARLRGVQENAGKDVAETLQDMSQMQELLKDFNQFEALYHAQQELAAQTQAYNRAGQLGREDQLALKELAATEKQVGDLLQQLEQKLLEDAKAAEKVFPKAAQSGRDLAKSIDELRLQSLARQATDKMLAGEGEPSFALAERLRGEMEKLFAECQGGNCPSGNELDTYLKLQRSMNPGKNFSQMSRSRKFGRAGGKGLIGATGEGAAGTSGYAVMGSPTANVIGNEQSAGQGSAAARESSRFGKGRGGLAKTAATEGQNGDVIKGLNPINRQSGAVASETVIEEYNDLVENYFRAITTKKKP